MGLMDSSLAKEKLRIHKTGLYSAGFPGYERNFSRDSLIYGLIASDKDALIHQVDYSAHKQGKKTDPVTGEEIGKIHHELPAGSVRGRPTTFNACDTNALFLIAVSTLAKEHTPDILSSRQEEIDAAILYIQNHIQDGLFTEDPKLCGAHSFALKVTYWKDSILIADHEEPHYPIVYSLVHFQNAYALQAIGKALKRNELIKLGGNMKQTGIKTLWREDHFVTAIDSTEIDNPSSDSLHALLYIEPDELPSTYAELIGNYSKQLETKAGYLSGITGYVTDDYHTRYVWVFEQALLHAAAKKHSLGDECSITERVIGYMGDGFPELIDSEDAFKPAGNNPQLWSIGARKYFRGPDRSLISRL